MLCILPQVFVHGDAVPVCPLHKPCSRKICPAQPGEVASCPSVPVRHRPDLIRADPFAQRLRVNFPVQVLPEGAHNVPLLLRRLRGIGILPPVSVGFLLRLLHRKLYRGFGCRRRFCGKTLFPLFFPLDIFPEVCYTVTKVSIDSLYGTSRIGRVAPSKDLLASFFVKMEQPSVV